MTSCATSGSNHRLDMLLIKFWMVVEEYSPIEKELRFMTSISPFNVSHKFSMRFISGLLGHQFIAGLLTSGRKANTSQATWAMSHKKEIL